MKRRTLIKALALLVCLNVAAPSARGCVPTFEQNGGDFYNRDCGIFNITCDITKKKWWNIYWTSSSGSLTASRIRFETVGRGYENVQRCEPVFHEPRALDGGGRSGVWELRVISQTESQQGGAPHCVVSEDKVYSEPDNCEVDVGGGGGGETGDGGGARRGADERQHDSR